MFGSMSSRVKVLVVLGALLNTSVLVLSWPLERSDLDDAILYKELEDLEDVVDQAILANLINEDLASNSAEDRQITDTLDDTPLLDALLKSAVRKEIRELTGKKSPPLPEGSEPSKRFSLKRGFDSISQSSGFGMPRGSFGGGSSGGDNLTFTFESLFPAIARGLRSAK